MTRRDERRVEKALQGADFPSDRDSLVSFALTRESDPKTMAALRTIPDRRYETKEQVLAAIDQEPEGEDEPGGTARW